MSTRLKQIVEIVETIDRKKENRLRPKKKVNHINTKTTRNTEKITKQMQSDLEGIASKISDMVARNRKIPLEKIREKFKVQVGSIIANGIRESYFLGLHFAEQFAERTITLSPEATNEINSEIADNIERFWNQVGVIIQKENAKREKVLGAAGPQDLALLNSFNKFFASSAITMNYFALNQGTIQSHEQVFRETIDDLGITVEGSIQVPKMLFVTRKDDRVDPQCLNLEGKTFDLDSIPSDEKPPVHHGCRCRLLPVENGRAFNA